MTFIVAGIGLLLLAAWIKNQFLIRAVYLVHRKGELDQRELAMHSDIVVTDSFDKFKEYAKGRMALWIDKNALDLIDRQWLYHSPQLYYPIVLVGYGDKSYSFDDTLGLCCYLGGPTFKSPSGSSELNTEKPSPGFSVLQLEPYVPRGITLVPPSASVKFMEEYTYKPHVEDILRITNELLDGTLKQPRAAPPSPVPTFFSGATPTLSF